MTTATETPALSGDLVPAGSYSPAEYEEAIRIPDGAQRVLIDIRVARDDAARAAMRLCALVWESRAHWTSGEEWSWRRAMEDECGIPGEAAAKMVSSWAAVQRYPAWAASLTQHGDSWDLDHLQRMAQALDKFDPEGELADDPALIEALSATRRSLRRRRVLDLLERWSFERRRQAQEELELEPPPAVPEVNTSLRTVQSFENEASNFVLAMQKIKTRVPPAGPLRDRLALAVDRASGAIDGLADALAAEDF